MEYHHLTRVEIDTEEGTVEEIGRYRLGERPEAAVEDLDLEYDVLED
jgi:hypothetical protein